MSPRRIFFLFLIGTAVINIGGYFFVPEVLYSLILLGPISLIGINDVMQKRQTLRRNFPVLANMRYILESIRPEISQYFIETDMAGRPLNRIERSVVYERSKKVRDTVPFGTQLNVYEVGYEWVNHSLKPIHIEPSDFRVNVGGPQCTKPYNASRLNISAMSFGSLSKNAILALSGGANKGHFAHNTGEGAISPYHLEGGADLIWQIGTGYFGCRTPDGQFNPETFQKRAKMDAVKMIEIKLSQGAKPGHGGILPGGKVTPEIAEIRDVEVGKDVNSPPGHNAFDTPLEMMAFVKQLRDLSGGKPVGIKLCVGRQIEVISIIKAMVETGIYPDFVTVDGGEGGTGAAPLEFSNHIGSPLIEGLIFVQNVLIGFDLRKHIRVIASGKVITGFDMVKRLALGADMCNAARAMMLALGCIQALQCNSNECPTGVATQKPEFYKGLDVPSKTERVFNYHQETLRSVCEMIGAMGLDTPDRLFPGHLMRRTGLNETKSYAELYQFLRPGDLLKETVPAEYDKLMRFSRADSFESM